MNRLFSGTSPLLRLFLAVFLLTTAAPALAGDIASFETAYDRLRAQLFQGATPAGQISGDPTPRQGPVTFTDGGLVAKLGDGPGWLFAVTPAPGTDAGCLLVLVGEDGRVAAKPAAAPPAGLVPVKTAPKAAPTPPTSRDEAYALLLDRLLGHSAQGKRVYVLNESVGPDADVALTRGQVSLSGGPGWLFFIDDHPLANWSHSCRFALVGQDGSIATIRADWPPRDLDAFTELTPSSRQSLVRPGRPVPPAAALPIPQATPAAHRYAVIISGGYNKRANYPRYWNDCSLFYAALKQAGFLDANIHVLFADGKDPAEDNADGQDSPLDLNGDGTPDIEYAATKENIALVFDQLAGQLGPDDILYVFTTDHGGNAPDNPFPFENTHVTLCLWNNTEITGDEFAAEVNKVSPGLFVGVFEQCFSGGLVEALKDPTKKRVLMSASRYWELSYASPTVDYDEFSYYVTNALAGTVAADSNGDGIVTLEEAYLHALAKDSYQSELLTDGDNDGEHPSYYSNPWDLGRKIALGGSFPGARPPLYAGYSQYQISGAIPEGGEKLAFASNDSLLTCALPFSFPFNGQRHETVTVSSNGQLFFGNAATELGFNSVDGIKERLVLAPMWDLLSVTDAAGDGVSLVRNGTTSVTFVWRATTRADATPRQITAAATLSANGQIRFLYGPGNVQTTRVAYRDKTIGVSRGTTGGTHYALRNGEPVLTDAKGVLFHPGPVWPARLAPVELLLLN